MENWQSLISLLEKHEAYPDFIAECVYAYIVNYSFETQQDKEFANQLVEFIKEVNRCTVQIGNIVRNAEIKSQLKKVTINFVQIAGKIWIVMKIGLNRKGATLCILVKIAVKKLTEPMGFITMKSINGFVLNVIAN